MSSISKTKFVVIVKREKITPQYQLELELPVMPEIVVSQNNNEEKKRGILVTNMFGDDKI
mgnify:CR=1 FL=1|tara:strand:+ start:543 stop:722 length:180 start_codon:yes stop_codon:yes gene_type:complete